jgi:hypothetical protein
MQSTSFIHPQVKEVSMPDPDYRALCAELLADYDNCHYRSELGDRARAALAQPEADEDCLVTKGLVDMFHYWDYQRYCKEND